MGRLARLYRQAGAALNAEPGGRPGPGRVLGPADIRALAAELGIAPTKTLGQNFVHDANTVRRIVAASQVGPDDRVVEVGPGLGSLTLPLLDTAGSVVAVEIDPVLAGRLPTTVAERMPDRADRLQVVGADALRVTAADLGADPTALVANLPYNVSVPVLLHLLTELPGLRTALVMVQAEVADRLAAAPGSRVYGVPSVKAGFFGRVRKVGSVGRSVFWPVPNVESGLVRVDRHDPAPWDTSAPARRVLFALVDAAFAQRRKTLRAALAGWAGSAGRAEEVLVAAGIDPRTRGEQLDTARFVELAAVARDRGVGPAT